jgi:hypothetical protein
VGNFTQRAAAVPSSAQAPGHPSRPFCAPARLQAGVVTPHCRVPLPVRPRQGGITIAAIDVSEYRLARHRTMNEARREIVHTFRQPYHRPVVGAKRVGQSGLESLNVFSMAANSPHLRSTIFRAPLAANASSIAGSRNSASRSRRRLRCSPLASIRESTSFIASCAA